MLIENVNDFSLWLIKELTGLSEADPETLSKYVIALLKKDKSENSLRKICTDQLNVFLADRTEKFIDNVFDCLKQKKFIKKCEISISSENDFVTKNDKNKHQFKISSSDEDMQSDFAKLSQNFKLKRPDDNLDNRSYSKRTRDHSGYKTYEEIRKKKRFNEDIDFKEKRYHSGRHKSHKTKKNVFDRIDYPHKYLEDNDNSKLIDYSNEKRLWDIKTSCSDFVEKGVCLKGDSCEFDHGLNIVRSDINCIYSDVSLTPNAVNSRWQHIPTWVEKFPISKPVQNILSLNNSYPVNITQFSSSNKTINDIYDPSHPEIDAPCDNDNKIKIINDSAPVYVPSQVESIQKEVWKDMDEIDDCKFEEGSNVTTVIGSGQNRQRYQRKVSPRSNNRFSNNNNDNRYNRRQGTARCLLLTHIPIECNDQKKLQQHFLAFGKVTDIQVGFQGNQHHALVEFATSDHARAAFRSPLPILGNRFIRTSLFARPVDSNNLTLCKDVTDDRNKNRKVQCNGSNNDVEMSMENESNEVKLIKNKIIIEKKIKIDMDESNRGESREGKSSVLSDFRHERRVEEQEHKPIIKQNEAYKCRMAEMKKDTDKKMKMLNDRLEMKNRIDRLEESVQACKNRLRTLLEEQKKPDCDQELIKRQLLESYNYFKELREMLEKIKKKYAVLPDISEEDKLKLRIKSIQQVLKDFSENDDEYKKQLKQITELKRELVKLQANSKKSMKRLSKLPTLVETKLDNRPKTLYVTGAISNVTMDEIRQMFKVYLVEKIEQSDNGIAYFAIKFKTRKESEKVLKEMTRLLEDKNLVVSFEKPIPVCDPLDFQTRSVPVEPLRGTPSRRDECASSDEDDDEEERN